jgi:iron(III) transport system substrate-binding protein
MPKLLLAGLSTITLLAATAFAAHAETIVVYSALETAKPAVKLFTARTDIDVNLVSLSTGELLGKVSAEGNNTKFDVLWVEGSAVMNRLATQSVLKAEHGLTATADYTSLGQRLVPKSEAYFPISASTTAIEVNTKKLGQTPAPKSWADLEQFAGFVGAKDPNLSGPAFQWLSGYLETVGIEQGQAELKKILTNRAISGIPGGGALNTAVITGDAKVGIQQDSAIYQLIAKGEPIQAVYPSEGVVALPASAGISNTTQHEDAAKKFIQFLLTPEAQNAMVNLDSGDSFFAPVITGVKGKGARVDNTASWKILDDEVAAQNEKPWKQWFRDSFVP